MSEELKPCPFCDKEPAPYWNGVGCVTSGCVLNGLHLDADKWNRRAQPAEAEGVEVVAYGMPNSAPGKAPRMMMVAIDIPGDDQYGGQLWEPLVRQSALSAVTAERDAARRECDENEGAMQVWRRRTAQAEAKLEALLSEVEALRKDAERYRWLRDQAPKARGEWEIDGQRYGMMLGADQDDVDQAVDALMSAMSAKEA